MPQAKGWVERVNHTLQDRLVKELRLRGINDIQTANAYLPEFMRIYNQRFAVPPKSPENVHRPLSDQDDLGSILVEKHTRILSKNLECQFLNRRFQIVTTRPAYALRNAPVTIVQKNDGSIQILYKGKPLEYQVSQVVKPALILNRKDLNAHLDSLAIPPILPLSVSRSVSP
ncbi:MAG TPA: hypothetical protein ENN77_02290 [Candidatus Wirthbacteria bacterium]|nr:hypothetical protein [Candidatus Wirthbacteria bacterium]